MKFKQNVKLDAVMVKAAMDGGIHGYMQAAFLRRDSFPTTQDAMDRAEWFKKQPKEYLNSVTAEIIKMEKPAKEGRSKRLTKTDMAVYREQELCPDCGQPYKAIHADYAVEFIGDSFIRWDKEGHVCGGASSLSGGEEQSNHSKTIDGTMVI